MGTCKKDVTPLLTHWSYIFLALIHRFFLLPLPYWICSGSIKDIFAYSFFDTQLAHVVEIFPCGKRQHIPPTQLCSSNHCMALNLFEKLWRILPSSTPFQLIHRACILLLLAKIYKQLPATDYNQWLDSVISVIKMNIYKIAHTCEICIYGADKCSSFLMFGYEKLAG